MSQARLAVDRILPKKGVRILSVLQHVMNFWLFYLPISSINLHRPVKSDEAIQGKAVAAGATILYGSDAGVLPHGVGAWQFMIMVERGLTPMQAIKSATSVAAQHIGLDNEIGSLSVRIRADLIAVRGDPPSDVKQLRDVSNG